MLRGSMAIAAPLQKNKYNPARYSRTLRNATLRRGYRGKNPVRMVAACFTSPANKPASSLAGDEQAFVQVVRQLVAGALLIEGCGVGGVRMCQHGRQEVLNAR